MLLVPAALAGALGDLAGGLPGPLGTPLIAHRWPDAASAVPAPCDLVDEHSHGETAQYAAARGPGRLLAPLPATAIHPAGAMLGLEGAMLETDLDASGRLLLAGAGIATALDAPPARWHETGISGRRLPDGPITLG
jgi:hypothetical protein